VKAIALALTILTGFTGLVYEVTWQKCLAILLGSHGEATAAVLGIFLGGLALGYRVFGRVTRWHLERAREQGRIPRLLLVYGFVEAGIGLHALVFPELFALAQSASLGLPKLSDGLAFGIDVGFTALLIGPPTVLMGGTIPILTQALSRSVEDATRVHAHVYAFNTAGAFAGALAAAFVLVPTLGLEGVLLWMGLVNLAVGTTFVLLGRGSDARASVLAGAAPPVETPPGFGICAAAALLLGFAMMTTQTVLIRVGGLALGASHFTFAMVVAVFVLCIALGSFAVSAASRIPGFLLPGTVWLLAGLLWVLHLEMENAPYYAHVLRTRFGHSPEDFRNYHLAVFGGLLAVLALPVGLSGASLPLLFHHLRRHAEQLGAVAGRLYSWNTVGNLLGALLGGYVLLLWLDLDQVYRIGVGAVALAAALLTALAGGLDRKRATVLVALAAVAVAMLPSWDARRLSSGLFRQREPLPLTGRRADMFFAKRNVRSIDFHADDPTATVVVGPAPDGQGRLTQRAIVINGKPDGSTYHDFPNESLAGLVPCLLATHCEQAFVIGFGTGVTAGELAALDSTEKVVVAEISRAVVEAAPLFDFANHRVSEHPEIEIVRSDAYRALLRREERFDVISSQPSNPWVSGVEMLYSREFLEAARERLRPGGVFAQWFQLYEIEEPTIELVLRTYRSVFQEAAIWYTHGRNILLLGFRDEEGEGLPVERMVQRASAPDFRAALRRSRVEGPVPLLAHEVVPRDDLAALSGEGEIHTLLHPILSHRAAQDFFRGGVASLPSAARLGDDDPHDSLLARLLAGRSEPIDEELRESIVTELCRTLEPHCATAFAWWQATDPDSERRPILLQRLRASAGETPDLDLETLETLADFYGHGRLPKDRYTYEEASRATELFQRHFAAPLPFDRARLAQIWARCEDSQGRCTTGRQQAETRLGGLPRAEDPHPAGRAGPSG